MSAPSSRRPGTSLRPLRRGLAGLLLPVLVGGLLVSHPGPAAAASGGRIGGGSFRSAPSMPRSYGGGTRGYTRGSGGYRGGYPVPYGGGFGGGGIGFPFLVPMFGFGGGGLLGFLVLMAVVGLLVNAVRGGGGRLADDDDGSLAPRRDGPVTIAQLQVGLLASARALQDDLRRLAASADTGSGPGLQKVLQETSLALLRHPDLWVYANAEVGQVPFTSAESTFNRLSMQERGKLRREVIANVGGQRFSDTAIQAGASGADNEYIAVTVLVAGRRPLAIKGADSADDLRSSLQGLGAIGADDLLALEVIWQPEGAGEVLSTEELLTAYPDLQHL